MRALVVQLGRMGDLAQTWPLIHSLREGGAAVSVACRPEVSEIFRQAELPASLLPVTPKLSAALTACGAGVLPPPEEFPAPPGLLEPVDLAVNVGSDPEAAALVSLVPSGIRLGRVHGPRGQVHTRGRAARYFWAMVGNRARNLFNLVDLNLLMAGQEPRPCPPLPLSAASLDSARSRLRDAGWGGEDLLIGLQLGASDFHRAWEPEGFARMAGFLEEAKPTFVLFGDKRERDRAAAFRAAFADKASGRVLDLAGKTTLADLPPLLRQCALLIGNDTGTLHVAAAVGVPTLAVFFATAFFTETAPYGEGHAVLQAELPCSPCNPLARCPEQKCRREIDPGAVASTALWMLGKGEAPRLFGALHLYRGGFAGDGTLLLQPVGKASEAYGLALAERRTWSKALGTAGRFQAPGTFEPGLSARAAADALPWIRSAAEAARALAGRGSDADAVAALSARLKEAPVRLESLPPGLFRDYCRLALGDLDSASPSGLLSQIAAQFEDLLDLAESLADSPGSAPGRAGSLA